MSLTHSVEEDVELLIETTYKNLLELSALSKIVLDKIDDKKSEVYLLAASAKRLADEYGYDFDALSSDVLSDVINDKVPRKKVEVKNG
jgi:hypothetical protein